MGVPENRIPNTNVEGEKTFSFSELEQKIKKHAETSSIDWPYVKRAFKNSLTLLSEEKVLKLRELFLKTRSGLK